jgi:phosphohistidine phosphatase SixA
VQPWATVASRFSFFILHFSFLGSVMQRRLIVMRHAKSSWASEAASDHDRPLNDRGRHDAPRIAERLVELGWSPEIVLSSDSRRTRETFDGMKSAFPATRGPEFMRQLYHAGVEALNDALLSVPDDVSTVLALGHNPGWQQAVYWLTGEAIEMKTATAVLMECDAKDWPSTATRRGGWKLIEAIYPKER